MERDQASVAPRFVNDLVQLRQLAGQPSYSDLERLSGHRLKRTTMSDVLNGLRVKIPDWRFVNAFVTACRAVAAENGLDANELGTISDWKRHWDGASSGVIDPRFPGHDSQASAQQWHDTASERTEPGPAAAAALPPPGPGDATAGPLVCGPLPSRLPDFVGREAWLAALRQALRRADRVGVVAIQGLIGVGKTQLAIEYASRYAADYDLVCWVPGDNAEIMHGALTDLANRIGIAGPAGGPDDGPHEQLFEVLRRRERFARWLIIFDNANEPEDIEGLQALLPGDVLVTTRNNRWEASGELLELDVFDRGESIEFLSRRLPKLPEGDAHRLADGVGDLPLLLEHAVESHVPADAYLARLGSDPLDLLREQPADYHSPIASVWRTAVDQLRADAPDAHALLCCLAFFGPGPVPRESLDRGSFLPEVSIHARLRDPIRKLTAIKKLRRAGLLRVHAHGSLELHAITRCAVRGLVARAGRAERERAEHDVHLLLAAADPFTPEDPATWRNYAELRGHAVAADAVACSHEMVRKFVVNLARYLNAAGDARAALAVSDAALVYWDADPAAGDSASADRRVAMRLARADALFGQGRVPEAFSSRREALAAMRSDPREWLTEGICLESLSGGLDRLTGKFPDALAASRVAVRTHVARFGNDDPRTFAVVYNLVGDLALNGHGEEAVRLAHQAYRDCRDFYNDDCHPAVLAARNVVGRCLWLSGRYPQAARVQAEVNGEYGELARSGMLDEDHPWRLAHEIDFAVTRRDTGLMPGGPRDLAADLQQVRRLCWRTLGPDHPTTLAATVVLASVLRRTDGQAGEAVKILTEADKRYQSVLPGHPYGHACGAFLAAACYQHASQGNARGSLEKAASDALLDMHDRVDQLAALVGAHPLALTARATLSNSLAQAGQLNAAVDCGQEALAGLRKLLGDDHPHTRLVLANIAAIKSGLPQAPTWFPGSGLAEIDFTPLPL